MVVVGKHKERTG